MRALTTQLGSLGTQDALRGRRVAATYTSQRNIDRGTNLRMRLPDKVQRASFHSHRDPWHAASLGHSAQILKSSQTWCTNKPS